MKILAIETSCDDTGIAILDIHPHTKRGQVAFGDQNDKVGHRYGVGINNAGFSVLANLVSSQIAVHAPWGGVVPSLAKREHQKSLVPLLFQALKQAKLLNKKFTLLNPRFAGPWRSHGFNRVKTIHKILNRETELLPQFLELIEKNGVPDIDAIAVTQGPGLEPALWVGVNFARALSFAWNKPLIAVSHLEGHIFANLLGKDLKPCLPAGRSQISNLKIIKFPAITLLVSGGHTQLILIKKLGQYKLLGETLDDAAGEAFDKVAKLLGLPYPGGPEISKLAEKGNPTAFNFPRPMLHHKNHAKPRTKSRSDFGAWEFSFSGLKTAVLYNLKSNIPNLKNYQFKADIAASFQAAAVEVLVKKTLRAAKEFNAKTVMISGGVAANQKLRLDLAESLKKEMPDVEFLAPSIDLCADNALMIALVGYFHQKKSISWQKLTALANLNFKVEAIS